MQVALGSWQGRELLSQTPPTLVPAASVHTNTVPPMSRSGRQKERGGGGGGRKKRKKKLTTRRRKTKRRKGVIQGGRGEEESKARYFTDRIHEARVAKSRVEINIIEFERVCQEMKAGILPTQPPQSE